MKFVLASFNPGKRREWEELMAGADLTLVDLTGVPGAMAPAETGGTLAENARIKARAALALTGLPAIGDDTALEVDALGGLPGVRSARYAGPAATDEQNRTLLLEALSGVPPDARTARFRTVCVAVFPEGTEVVAEGVLEGRIAERPRGGSGFGYDSIFELPELQATLAELAAEEKNRLSHRARAVRELRQRLSRRSA